MPTSELSNDQLAALWERGAALDSAWIQFAEFFDSFAHRALRTYPSNDADVLAAHPRYKELANGWLPRTWEARKEKLAVTAANERLHLLDEIYAGRLWAIGFRTLRDGSDGLARIPRRHFLVVEGVGTEIQIDWAKSELTLGRATYFDVRIAQAPTGSGLRSARPRSDHLSNRSEPPTRPSRSLPSKPRTATLQEKKKKKKRKKVGGSPGTKSSVIQSFHKLWRERPEFRELSVKSMVAEVRAEILGDDAKHEERSGYRSSSMERWIGRELSVVRNRKIPNKPNKPRAT